MPDCAFGSGPRTGGHHDARRSDRVDNLKTSMLTCLALTVQLAGCGAFEGNEGLISDAEANTSIASPSGTAGAVAQKPNELTQPELAQAKVPTSGEAAASAETLVKTLVDDMKLFHDGPARTLQWIRGWGSGWEYPKHFPKPEGWLIAQPWGVITGDTSHPNAANPISPWRVSGPYTGNQAPNTRVQVRDLQLWWLKADGQWVRASNTAAPGGDAYHASWQGDVTKPADVRSEAANGGGISVRYINHGSYDEFLYHFYGSRTQVPVGYVGFASAYYARKILHDPAGVDDRAKARLMAQVAGDWWTTADARWDYFKTNGPMGYNRYKYLSNEWQLISFHSLSEAQIRANPPPIQRP